jgi:hypothetical protein
MNELRCPLAKSDCGRLVNATYYTKYCCSNYTECSQYQDRKDDEVHTATSWINKIDKWRNKFK